jgi:hypothetical protein
MTLNIISIETENKTTFSDVENHGLLGKIIRFIYTLSYENDANRILLNSGKFRRLLKTHFRKKEIKLFGSIIVHDNLSYVVPIWRPIIYAFYYYEIICDYLTSRAYMHKTYPMNTDYVLCGLVGRIREKREKRILKYLCQLPLQEVHIIHIFTYLYKHVKVSYN